MQPGCSRFLGKPPWLLNHPRQGLIHRSGAPDLLLIRVHTLGGVSQLSPPPPACLGAPHGRGSAPARPRCLATWGRQHPLVPPPPSSWGRIGGFLLRHPPTHGSLLGPLASSPKPPFQAPPSPCHPARPPFLQTLPALRAASAPLSPPSPLKKKRARGGPDPPQPVLSSQTPISTHIHTLSLPSLGTRRLAKRARATCPAPEGRFCLGAPRSQNSGKGDQGGCRSLSSPSPLHPVFFSLPSRPPPPPRNASPRANLFSSSGCAPASLGRRVGEEGKGGPGEGGAPRTRGRAEARSPSFSSEPPPPFLPSLRRRRCAGAVGAPSAPLSARRVPPPPQAEPPLLLPRCLPFALQRLCKPSRAGGPGSTSSSLSLVIY
ncbi:uncharacterized protein LOC140701682 [Pogona vitticeps]